LPDLDARHRAIAEEAVHPLDDLGITCWISGACAGVTTSWRMPSAFSPGGKRIDRARSAGRGAPHDLGPARDHRTLHEAEAAKGGAADRGHQVGDLPRLSATRARTALPAF
jgi:hypothetical protein